jgi:glycosyltransferase involved in cell wall biosynthesis
MSEGLSAARPIRVAIIADYPEEGWLSMDLTARMILDHLAIGHADEVEAVRICPPYRARLARLPIRRGVGRNFDRAINRHVDYPRHLRRLVRREPFDVYHVVDHSYAQLVPALPRGRTVVTCHDLDAFRCLLRPDLEPRPAWFRALARRILRGLQAAAVVACDSEATRKAILDAELVPERRLRVVPIGIPPEYFEPPGPAAELEVDRLVGPLDRAAPPMLLHVGSNIPRKRIDVLLDVFAGVRRAIPGATLIKAGGGLSPAQIEQARGLGVLDAIRFIPFLEDRRTLAALYRRAAIVLQPSEAEGFGIPLAEAMAVGAPLLVSDLAVLREVAGDAAVYRPVGDVAAWVEAAVALLGDHSGRAARREIGLARTGAFHWKAHAASLVAIYHDILAQPA